MHILSLRNHHSVRLDFCNLKSLSRIQICVCTCSHGIRLPRRGAIISFFFIYLYRHPIFAVGQTFYSVLTFMPLKQQKKLLILGIYTINFIRNEILSDYYALLIDSSLRPISQSLVHKICMHLNLHSRYSDYFILVMNSVV